MDNTLSYKYHIGKQIASCSVNVFTLSKIRRFISEPLAVLIYKCLIMAKLSYGGVVCIGARKQELETLQKIQNRALRICYRASRYTSNISLHRQANVLPLFLRRKYELYNVMYKCLSGRKSSPTNVRTPKPATRYSLSRPPSFTTPNSYGFINSVTYQGPLNWAGLPNAIKNLASLPEFQCEVKKLVNNEMSLVPQI